MPQLALSLSLLQPIDWGCASRWPCRAGIGSLIKFLGPAAQSCQPTSAFRASRRACAKSSVSQDLTTGEGMSWLQSQPQMAAPNTSSGVWAKAHCQLCAAGAPTNLAGDPFLQIASWACWSLCSWQLCQCEAPLSIQRRHSLMHMRLGCFRGRVSKQCAPWRIGWLHMMTSQWYRV